MPGADGWVSLGIRTDTKKRLENRGDMTDSYDDVVSRLLDRTADDT
jgi:hypothetical protein